MKEKKMIRIPFRMVAKGTTLSTLVKIKPTVLRNLDKCV